MLPQTLQTDMFKIKFKIQPRLNRGQNLKLRNRRRRNKKLEWYEAPDVKKLIDGLVKSLEFEHVSSERIFCFRTTGTKSRAIARIWSFPKIFQHALKIEPAYVIEVVSERFNKMGEREKTKVLIHELLHIPKNFSGSLLPHRYGNIRIDKEVERLYRKLS